MAKTKDSCCGDGTKVVLVCAGASNVGQITNEVAKSLDREGVARFFCLAGVGGHVSGMIASVEGAARVLVLDGCPVGCGKKCMDEAGLAGYKRLVVTELGVEKQHTFDLRDEDLRKTTEAARARLAE